MKLLKTLGRPLLLLALLSAGVGLIFHIGYKLIPRDPGSVPSASVVEDVAAPAPVQPDNPPPSARAPAQVSKQANPGELITTPRGRFIATDAILFNSGASTMREASYPKLDRIADFLTRHPELAIQIIGHTDNLGPEPVNQQVSAERAEIVMHYLVSRGIEPSRLKSKGMGSLDPITFNDTQLGRQANRRIEFLVDAGAAARR